MTAEPVGRQWWRGLSTCWVLLAGCGAATPVRVSAAEVPEAPPRSGALWAPSEPIPAVPGGFAWSEVQVQTACAADASAIAPQQRTITSAAEFEHAFCQRPQLDFGRFRLVLFKVAQTVVAVDVVPNAERISVVVQTHASCDSGWGAQLALLVPVGPEPVVLIERPGPAVECRNGYGY